MRRVSYAEFLMEYWRKNEFSPIVRGEIVPGNNGLYGDPETEFRNLAHWVCIACDLGEAKDERQVQAYVREAIATLIEEYPGSGPFVARLNPSKDQSNGLIGTTWVLEALCRAYRAYQLQGIRELAISLIQLYPFDFNEALWPTIVEPDGQLKGLDRTLNHQLWFSASVAEASALFQFSEGTERASCFRQRLNKHMRSNRHGMVYHTIGTGKHYYRTVIKRLIQSTYRKEMHKKEWGYHAFNLLGLCRWAEFEPGRDLDDKLREMLRRCNRNRFWQEQKENLYGPSYNPVGIEIAVARDIAGHSLEDVCDALNRHFAELYHPTVFAFSSPTDPATLNARLYEMTCLSSRAKAGIMYEPGSNRWLPRA